MLGDVLVSTTPTKPKKSPAGDYQECFQVNGMHLIRMTRNAWNGEIEKLPEKGPATDGKDIRRFYLFDYFDELCYTPFDNDSIRYTAFIGSEDPFEEKIMAHPPLAFQYLTLAELEYSQAGNGNPFTYETNEQQYLSDKPFLSLINVTINPTGQETPLSLFSKDFTPTPEAILGFLNRCMDRFKEACDLSVRAIYRVFYSLTSSSFCIAMRSADISAAYRAEHYIKSLSDSDVIFNAFTAEGIEYRKNSDGIPLTFSPGVAMGTEIVLRISAREHSAVDELISKINVHNEGAKQKYDALINTPFIFNDNIGLNGRYDISLRIPFEQFKHLYPILAYYKFETRRATDELTAYKNDCKAEMDTVVAFIADQILDNGFNIINERALFGLEGLESKKQKKASPVNRKDTWLQNVYMAYKAGELRSRSMDLPYNRKQFIECMKLILDLIKTYSNIRYECDARINGHIFFAQILVLLNSVESQLNAIQSFTVDTGFENRVQSMCTDLTEWMRIAIDSLNGFEKLLQSINQQTIQSPNYEMSSRIDMEKFLIGYCEFLRKFTADFYSDRKGDSKRMIFPFFTIDFSTQSIIAKTLFDCPIRYEKDRGFVYNDDQQLLVAIYSPSYNAFASIYETYPLISHEISHMYRFIGRAERNEVLKRYVFRKIAKYITSVWIVKTNNNLIYHNLGFVEDDLSEVIFKELCDSCKVSGDEPFNILEDSLTHFLNTNFFVKNDDYARLNPELKDNKDLSSIFKKLFAMGMLSTEPLPADLPLIASYQALDAGNARSVLDMLMSKAVATTLVSHINLGLITGFKSIYEKCLRVAFDEIVRVLKKEMTRALSEKMTPEKADATARLVFPAEGEVPAKDAAEKFLEAVRTAGYTMTLEKQIETVIDIIKTAFENRTDLTDERRQAGRDALTDAAVTDKDLRRLKKEISDIVHDERWNEALKIELPALTQVNRVTFITKAEALYEKLNVEITKVEGLAKSYKKLLGTNHTVLTGFEDVLVYDIFMLRQTVKSFIQGLSDINHLYNAAMQTLDNLSLKHEVNLDRLISAIQVKLRLQLNEKYYKDGKEETLQCIFINSKEFYALLSALCINLREDQETFPAHFKKALFSITSDDVEKMVSREVGIYSEIFADLCMCAAFQFDAFAYLRFFVQSFLKVRQPLMWVNKDADSERAAMVVLALIRRRYRSDIDKDANRYHEFVGKGMSQLLSKIKSFISNTVSAMAEGYTEGTARDIKKDVFLRGLYEYATTLAENVDDISRGKMPVLVKSYYETKTLDKNLFSAFEENTQSKKINVDPVHYAEYLNRLEFMVIIAYWISTIIHIKDEFADHFYEVYNDHIDGGNRGCQWEKQKAFPGFRADIRDFYKNTEFKNLDKSAFNTLYKRSLPFVFYYYYLNRHTFGKEIHYEEKDWPVITYDRQLRLTNTKDFEKVSGDWLKSLMGHIKKEADGHAV